MQNNSFIRAEKNYKLIFVAALLAFVGALAFTTGDTRSFAAPTQTAAGGSTAQSGAPASATEARRLLGEINAENFARIRDARMRGMAQRSYDALKAIADNDSRAREAGLIATFDRTIKSLKAAPPHTSAMGLQTCDESYKRCIELCKETGSNCDLCRLGNEGCYLNVWAAARETENDPSKH